ncbi:hypothetical protein LCGC14_3101640 [marine sediment metagenome]|uniref:Uncharacterized protein n=1 Tax=marine sediment metagenome TaxID=412755 RepID=A0A0F8YF38_9ZZZZ|nr:hypothetical protein [Candidatus Scalindua sp.]
MEDKDCLLEQYKILMGLYDTEVTRFWTRFNLFLGFQIALAAGIFSGSKFFAENTPIFRLTMIAILVISFSSAVIHLRGHIRQRHLLKAISVIESNSKGVLILLATYRSITNESPSGNSFIASIVGVCMTMFWLVLFIYLEICGYTV